MISHKYWVIPFFLLLAACAPKTKLIEIEEVPLNEKISLEKRKTLTSTISSWEITGAMAAKSQAKAWSANINWVQHGSSSYQIRLMGPLGGGTALINKSGNQVTFQEGAKKASANNAEELLVKQTGIRLPVNNLYYWVRGIPAPGQVQAEQHDAYNHLSQLKQNGYTINFLRYTSVKGVDLPNAIHLIGNGVTVKLIIKKWQV